MAPPLLGPLPARSSQGEEGKLDAAPCRWLTCLLTSLILTILAPSQLRAQTSEFRGLWVDAWSGDFSTASKCTQLIADTRAAHFNALVVQVRRRGDSLYHSLYEPWISTLNGSFDPLQDLITKAHDTAGGKQRIEIHAWIVTYNIWNNETTAPAASTPPHPYNAHRDWLTRDLNGNVFGGGNYAFDPAHPDVQKHTFNVAMDLVTRYDIDGLNFDYIRYAGTSWGYHDVAVARFNARQGRTGLPPSDDEAWKQFRRDQVTALLRKTYLHAIAIKPTIKISADTITWAPGPTSDATWYSSASAWNNVLQDWRGWMEEGILDLNIPMNYFDHASRATDFLNWSAFAKNHRFNRHVAIGPGLYLNTASNAIVQLREFRQPTASGHRADGVCGYVYKLLNEDNLIPRAQFLAALTQPSTLDPITPPVFAQTASPPPMLWKTTPTRGHLKGFVRQQLTQADLDGATVRLSGPAARALSTDGTGFFGAVDLPPGAYTLTASFPGLESRATNFVVTAGTVTTRDLFLAPSAANLFISRIDSFPGRTEAIVSWQFAEPVPGGVDYGLTANLGSATALRNDPGTNRNALLPGLTPDQTYFYRILARTTQGDLRSDIQSFRLAGEDIIDNALASFSGSWTAGTGATDKHGTNYRYAGTTTGAATASATFTPFIQTPGYYDIYAWAPGGSNRSTNAPHEVVFDAGSLAVRLDQVPQNAGWRLLAANRHFLRGTNGFVRISNSTGETGKVVMADAIRWVYASGQEPPPNRQVPEWWARFYFGAPASGLLDPDLDGYPNHAEYLFGTAPNRHTSTLDFQISILPNDRFQLLFAPARPDRTYRLQSRNRFGADPWVAFPTGPAELGADGQGTFTLTNAPTTTFFRLQVELKP